MACNWYVITCHYMHYMSLHATEDANVEFQQTGRLARGRVSEKQPSEVRAGPPVGAKASRSKIQKWSVTQTAKN